MKTILPFYLLLIIAISTSAQKKVEIYQIKPVWIDMMKDPNANFFETQKAFYAYMENKDVSTTRGYKQFKRWEWFMKTRVDENGNKPAPKKIITNYNSFIEKYGKPKNNSNWKNLGPIDLPNNYITSPVGLGRINTIAFHPFNDQELLIGSPSGGLWKTTDHGGSWTCLSDAFPTLGVSAVAYDPENPLIIYIGTGDRDGGDAPGLGVMKSIDGGNSWIFVDDIPEIAISKIMVNPVNTNIVYAATVNGFYKSIDKGINWEQKNTGEYLDFQLKPDDPNTVYAARYGSLNVSNDGGETWTNPDIMMNGNRMLIAVTPANPNYVYVMLTNQRTFKGFYFSENAGESFTFMCDSPNIMGRSSDGSDDDGQSWYDACLVADRDNPNIVYAGGIQVWKSDDNGLTWNLNAHDRDNSVDNVHVDHHFLNFSPLNGNIYLGNDGGIYYTNNQGDTWNDITGGLAISQLYKLGQSPTVKDMIMCGYQDNSTTIYRNGKFSTVIGADGMECQVDYADTSYKYGAIQYGSIRRSYEPNRFRTIGGTGVNGITESGGWVTPYALHSTDPTIMFAGYYNLWRTKNVRDPEFNVNWERISFNLGNSNSNFIIDLEQSTVNDNILYISRDDGKVFRSDNINDDMPDFVTLAAIGGYYIITDIEAHPYDENIVFTTKANGTVYKSINRGDSWSNITFNLPDVSFNCLVYDKTSSGGLYIGTDAGVYYKDDYMDEWILYGNNFPVAAEVTELDIYYDEDNRENSRLRAATYGRGLWSTPLYDISNQDYFLDAAISSFALDNNEICFSEFVIPQLTVSNEGSDTINSINIQLLLNNDTIQEKLITQELIPQASIDIVFNQVSATYGKHIFEARIAKVDGDTDSDASNNSVIDTLRVSIHNQAVLHFQSDNFASQTSWEIKQEDAVIYSNPANFLDGEIIDTTIFYCLTEGCYTFYIYDENNDGLCCSGGNGLLELFNYSLDTIFKSFGSFTAIDSIEFCIDDVQLPIPNFSISVNELCINNELMITDLSQGDMLGYSWNFGNGALPLTSENSGNQMITYTQPGFKTISLTLNGENGSITETKENLIEILSLPEIVEQSSPVIEKCERDTAKLFVNAKNVLSVQWYKESELIDYTSTEINFTNLEVEQSGKYYCKIMNTCDTITSDTIELVVHALPNVVITTESTTFCEGESVTLTASGADSYVWSASTLDTNRIVVTPASSKQYSVTGTSSATGCSNTGYIALNLLTNPILTKDIADTNYCDNSNIVMYVGAQGNHLNFEWTKDAEIILGENSPFYIIDTFTNENTGTYKCLVFNSCGEVSTSEAIVGIQYFPTVELTYSINDLAVSFTSINENAQYYHWAFGDNTFSTEENPVHTYARTGTYNVVHKAINYCGTSQAKDTIRLWPESILELAEKEDLRIYPNPNDGTFEIQIDENLYNATLSVIGINGKLIKQITKLNKENKEPIKLSLTNVENGFYFIYLYSDERIYLSKLIINRN